MSTPLTHTHYVASVRRRMAALAQDMLNGSMPFLEGSTELASLRGEAELDQSDEDLAAFTLIASEIDHLPIGASGKFWSEQALARCQPEVDATIRWAKQFGVPACESLIQRFQS